MCFKKFTLIIYTEYTGRRNGKIVSGDYYFQGADGMDSEDSVVIDDYAHCGIQDHSFDQSFESYLSCVRNTGIKGMTAFLEKRKPDFPDIA
jgi:hypothetical protein